MRIVTSLQGDHMPLRAAVIVLAIAFVLPCLSLSSAAAVDPSVFGSGIGRFQSLYSGDIDGDGAHEVLFGSYEGYVTQLQYRAGDFFVEWRSPKMGERCWGLRVGDCDDDDDLEIVIGDGEGDLWVYDAATHKLEWKRQGEMVRDAHGIAIADLEDDGRTEVVVGTGYKTDQGWGTIYVWAGDGSQPKPLRSYGPYDSRLRGLEVADLDGDGRMEIAVGCGANLGDIEGSGFLRVLDASTGAVEWTSPDLGGDCEGLVIADVDADERPDIVVGEGYRYREGRVHVLQWDPSSSAYTEQWRSEDIGPKPWGVAVGDCDGDGLPEMVVGNQPGYVRIYDATTHVEEWKSELLGTDIFGACIDDVDGDGRAEVVLAQGGYQGKGDFTSGYTTPHIYVMDGATHEFEHVLGERNLWGTALLLVLLLLVIVALIELGLLTKRYRLSKEAARAGVTGEAKGGPKGPSIEGGVPGWKLDMGDECPSPPDGGPPK
jgi:hypothetical protein